MSSYMIFMLNEYLSYVEMDAYVKGELIIIYMLRNPSKDLDLFKGLSSSKRGRLLSLKPLAF